MPRSPRDDHAGAWHHVMNRSIDGATLFLDDTDRRIFLTELRDACSAARVEIHAYCLLATHYHLLLHTPQAGLSDAMQHTGSRFTQALNRRRRRDGPLFRGRFKSVEITTDEQLTWTSRYIHLNPVEAGLASRAEDWPWSSAAGYLCDGSAPEWLCTAHILRMFLADDPRLRY